MTLSRPARAGRGRETVRETAGSRPEVLAGVLAALWAPVSAFGDEGGAGFYAGDLGQAIAALVIFIVLLAILGRWAWKPLIVQLRRREESIANTIERSEAQQREAEDLLNHYRSRLERAEAEAKGLLDGGRRQAATEREEILVAARVEAQQATARAREEIEQAKRTALEDLQQTTAQLAAEIAERVLATNLDQAEHDRLMEDALGEIRQAMAEKH